MLLDLLLSEFKEETIVYSYVDKENLFLTGGLNIVYGEKAVGKTYCVLKALKQSGITPVFIDYDKNEVDITRFRGSDLLIEKVIEASTVDDVVVIDHLDGFSKGKYMSEEDATTVLKRLSRIQATIILLAHATTLRSATRKSNYFRGNDKIANNADTVYRLENNNLYIEKKRGSSLNIIKDWMR